jgi:hypothetical protein
VPNAQCITLQLQAGAGDRYLGLLALGIMKSLLFNQYETFSITSMPCDSRTARWGTKISLLACLCNHAKASILTYKLVGEYYGVPEGHTCCVTLSWNWLLPLGIQLEMELSYFKLITVVTLRVCMAEEKSRPVLCELWSPLSASLPLPCSPLKDLAASTCIYSLDTSSPTLLHLWRPLERPQSA